MGVIKYCRHILRDHETFFKLFDWPQNISLCSIFVILFFKLRGFEHKISKLAIKEIQKRRDMINKSHPLIHLADIREIVNSDENKKTMFDAF